MLELFVFLFFFGVLFFFIRNKNKKAGPNLLESRTSVYRDIAVDCPADVAYKALLQFGQASDYKIDYVNNARNQLILNYSPKMGEQTNGTFFPIWIESISDRKSRVCVGAKDKSIAMAFEEERALSRIVPLIEAALYSIQGSIPTTGNSVNNDIPSWSAERDLSSDGYQIYLVKKFGVEKNDVLGKFIANGRSYTSVEEALLSVHEKDLAIEAEKNIIREARLSAEAQDAINNDTSKVRPETHTSCVHCNGYVRKEATKCRHCGRKLVPKKS